MGNLKERVRDLLRKGAREMLLIVLICMAIRVTASELIRAVLESRDAQSWIRTDAWVESVEPNCTHDRVGWSCDVLAAYRYSFAGREHRGTRVGVMTGLDRSIDWNRLWYERLHSAIERKAPVSVYVDPQDPDRSLLDRDYEGRDKYILILFLLSALVMGVMKVVAWFRAIAAWFGAIAARFRAIAAAFPPSARRGAGAKPAAAAPQDTPPRGSAGAVR